MERRIKQSIFFHMVLTLQMLEWINCCNDGTGSYCPRFVMNVSNHSTANLDWIDGDVVSMMKSRYFTDILYITSKNGGFYEFNIIDGSHTSIPHSSDLKVIDQLIQVNYSLILAADQSSNLVKLISLDNSSSDQTLLCRGTNCCLNNSLCFESPELQLGKVVIGPENPYHLYFVNGSKIQTINLDTIDNETKQVRLLHTPVAQSVVLKLTLDNNFTSLTAAIAHYGASTLSYYTIDLTTSSEVVGKPNLISAPPKVKTIDELGGGILVTLQGNGNEMMLIDMAQNKTLNLCEDVNSASILITPGNSKCKGLPIDLVTSITVDKDYIYASKEHEDRRLFIIRYSSIEPGSSSPQDKSETVTVHADIIGSADGPKWMEISVATLGTVLSLLIIGVVCRSVVVRMRRRRQSSKRYTVDHQRTPPNNIQDIELMEIASSLSQQQTRNVDEDSVQQTTIDISLPEAAHEHPSVRPLPPLPSSIARDMEVDIENYETPLPLVNSIIEDPPPPPPCPGPSTAHKMSLVSSVPFQHSNEYYEQCDSSARYCDKPRGTSDIHRARRTSPNMVLDPVLLQEALTAIQSTSNQRVSSVTLTDRGNERQVKFELMPQPVPTPEHEYLTIKDN